MKMIEFIREHFLQQVHVYSTLLFHGNVVVGQNLIGSNLLCEVIVDLYLNILGVYFKMSRSFMAGLDSFDGIMTSCFVLQNFTFF